MDKVYINTRKIVDYILSVCFPDKCVACGSKGTLLCELCIQKTRHPERDLAKDIYAACDYRDPQIKRALLYLKYYRKRRLGIILGTILYERLMEEIADIRIYTRGSPIILVPVPLSQKRRKERGYNQAEDIARGLIEASSTNGIPLFELNNEIVIKNKDTKPQAKIKNRNERLNNLKNCFKLNPKKDFDIKGRTIIVIDDITTTGSTIEEVVNVLREAGAKKVVGFAVAH